MATTKTISGARARFYLNGKYIGWATGVRGAVNVSLVPIPVMGLIDPVEYVPTDRMIAFSADFVRFDKENLKKEGLYPVHDNDPVAATVTILNFPLMSAALYDVTDGTVILRLQGVTPENHSWNVDRGGIYTENVTFRALRLAERPGELGS